ncbi:MAG: LysR substrate-binding domain-containing protein [Pseudomonadota bacterium]
MERHQLSDVSVFVEVARARGFRAAANVLNLGPGTVSEAVQRLEDRLGVRLFERSTRSIALTPAGQRLYEQSMPAIADLESAVRELEDARDGVSGTLRLNAPRTAGPFFLDKLISDYADKHPEVAVELIYDDSKVDLVASGIDAAIRSATMLEQDSYAMPIGPKLDMSVVASPEYLKRSGVPNAPKDILSHEGICFAFDQTGQLASWNFKGKDGVVTIMPKPRMVTNDLQSALRFAEAGLGLAYVYAEAAKDLIADGRLFSLLEKKTLSLPRYSLNYRSKRHVPARLRAFIDLAKAKAN